MNSKRRDSRVYQSSLRLLPTTYRSPLTRIQRDSPTRPERKAKHPQALAKMVRFCVSQTGAGIFPEHIDHITAYLNQQFYKFKQ